VKPLVILSLLFVLLTGAPVRAAELEIVVRGSGLETGVISISLFLDQSSYLKKPLSELRLPAGDGNQVTGIFRNLTAGVYAVTVIHDRNSNGELDTNFFGIPTESYGFSNNATAMFGPPSFSEVSIKIGKRSMSHIIVLGKAD